MLGRPGTFSGLRWVALGRAELGCAQLGATSAAILVGSIPGGAARGVSLRLPWTSLHMAPKDIPTKTELPSPAKNPVVQTGCTPFAVPKKLPKPADAPTPPTVPAADESSTGNSDCTIGSQEGGAQVAATSFRSLRKRLGIHQKVKCRRI